MTRDEPQPSHSRVETAVAAFMRRLIAGGLTAEVARLETRLTAARPAAALFAAEAVMARAWGDGRAALPTHELIWVSSLAPETPAGWMRIRALDSSGHVLLDLVAGVEPATLEPVGGAAHG